jgi:signal peptidase I
MKNKKYKIAVFAIISLAVMLLALAKPYRISGDCMEPAIKDGHLYFLNRVSPYIRQYQIGDIIVFKHEEKMWISRIVALEMSMIQIVEGSVIVNGAALQDKEVHRNWSGWKYGVYALDKPFQVPKNSVFVLSDNLSAQHDDSRVFGSISKDSISGLIW